MADVNVNALTTISTEPTSTDSLVCVNRSTNEGLIIDYNLLAGKILDKLASKTYASLTTTVKNLPGAINELDSDTTTALNNLFPDYSTNGIITLDSGTFTSTDKVTVSGTFDQNGYVRAYIETRATIGMPFIAIYINGKTVWKISKPSQANYKYIYSPLIPVQSGTPYSIELQDSVGGAGGTTNYYAQLFKMATL